MKILPWPHWPLTLGALWNYPSESKAQWTFFYRIGPQKNTKITRKIRINHTCSYCCFSFSTFCDVMTSFLNRCRRKIGGDLCFSVQMGCENFKTIDSKLLPVDREPTDIHTYRQTDRQTDRHTNPQDRPTYLTKSKISPSNKCSSATAGARA